MSGLLQAASLLRFVGIAARQTAPIRNTASHPSSRSHNAALHDLQRLDGAKCTIPTGGASPSSGSQSSCAASGQACRA